MSVQIASKEWKGSSTYKLMTQIGIMFLATGAGIAAWGGFSNAQHFWHVYLVMFMFLLSLSLGALFYVALEHLVGAYWSVPIRRVTESLSGLLVPVALLAIPIFLLGMDQLYSHWIPHHAHIEAAAHGNASGHDQAHGPKGSYAGVVEHSSDSHGSNGSHATDDKIKAGVHHEKDPIIEGKRAFLNEQMFLVLNIGCFLIWIAFSTYFRFNSKKQDIDGDSSHTRKNATVAAPFMLIFAATITIAAIYYMMSLEPHWFSTMFGVYYFAGTLVSAASILTILVIVLHQGGFLHSSMKKDTYYSLGLMMFAFNVFWAYISFSQFMLIWYANLPEETMWFTHRYEGGWATVSWCLIVFHFVIPFFALLSRNQKTNPNRLMIMAYWLLAAHIYDLYWIIVPASKTSFHYTDLGFVLFAAGFVMFFFSKEAGRASLVPLKDPKLEHGLEFRIY